MKWSWKLGRFAGIDAYVHASFLLLLGWAAWVSYAGAGTGVAALLGVVFLVGVFASVLLHELGHALTARRYGIETRRIDLLPIGGVAQLEGEPGSARQELAIALAGPAVNFVLATVLFGVVTVTGLPVYGLVGSLMVANLTLGLFNLVPAFPMDGGRVLRALLASRMDPYDATQMAVQIGKAVAVGMGVIGLFTNWWLMLVAAFVWFAASQEGRRGVVYGQYRGRGGPRGTPMHEYVDAPASAWRAPSQSTSPSSWSSRVWRAASPSRFNEGRPEPVRPTRPTQARRVIIVTTRW